MHKQRSSCSLSHGIRALLVSLLLLLTNYATWLSAGGLQRLQSGASAASPALPLAGVAVKASSPSLRAGAGSAAAAVSALTAAWPPSVRARGSSAAAAASASKLPGGSPAAAADVAEAPKLPAIKSKLANFCTPPAASLSGAAGVVAPRVEENNAEEDEEEEEEEEEEVVAEEEEADAGSSSTTPTTTHAAAVQAAQWDSVALWPASALGALVAHPCFLTTLDQQRDLGFLPVHICTHDPEVDQVMAASFHSHKWWGANLDHKFMLGGGHASGRPLQPLEAGAMREASARARARGTPFKSLKALEKALRLPPPPPAGTLQRSMCSRERPFVLDIGGNIGYYTLVAAATGCSVVTVEPLAANVGRLWQSVVANRFERQVTLYKNAVGKDRRLVTLALNRGNPGASSVSDGSAAAPAGGSVGEGAGLGAGGDSETVATIVLDELFDGSAQRPVHPFTGRPISPRDIAVVKVDVEGYDAAALWSLRGAIEAGRPPLIKVEYVAGDVRGVSGCDNAAMMRWFYSLGYTGRALGVKEPLTLAQWEELIIPLLLEGKMQELHEQHKIPQVRELYMVHEDADETGLAGLFGN